MNFYSGPDSDYLQIKKYPARLYLTGIFPADFIRRHNALIHPSNSMIRQGKAGDHAAQRFGLAAETARRR